MKIKEVYAAYALHYPNGMMDVALYRKVTNEMTDYTFDIHNPDAVMCFDFSERTVAWNAGFDAALTCGHLIVSDDHDDLHFPAFAEPHTQRFTGYRYNVVGSESRLVFSERSEWATGSGRITKRPDGLMTEAEIRRAFW